MKITLLQILILLAAASSGWGWTGTVSKVIDGDTITVQCGTKEVKVRLYGIDSPEKAQEFGRKAAQITKNLAEGRLAEVEAVTTDRYGRTVGLVKVDEILLNEELVRSGYAWVYRRYCDRPVCRKWLDLETDARKAKKGLWQNPAPLYPLKWKTKMHPNR